MHTIQTTIHQPWIEAGENNAITLEYWACLASDVGRLSAGENGTTFGVVYYINHQVCDVVSFWVAMRVTKCQFDWWRKLEYPEETTDIRQVTDETCTHTAHAVPVPTPDRRGVKPGDVRCQQTNALAYSVTEAPMMNQGIAGGGGGEGCQAADRRRGQARATQYLDTKF